MQSQVVQLYMWLEFVGLCTSQCLGFKHFLIK